ncbi:hypothetical protein EDC44_13225 [Cricetibacter osteomyelitidis]|uniref:Uncharacterized protein n=1 Tax=Cricetibacter osteomyelitidis TaxID=1521931 RepID=A0A4R2SQB2_9PAST|nr:hypothetical protein EDC44_13225 [Cricetibacter osteomyelitidis]
MSQKQIHNTHQTPNKPNKKRNQYFKWLILAAKCIYRIWRWYSDNE